MSVVPDQTIWNMAGQSPVYRSYWESCLPPLAVAGRGWVLEAQSSIHSCSLFSEASMQWSVAGHPGLADVGHRLSLMPVESLRAKRVRGLGFGVQNMQGPCSAVSHGALAGPGSPAWAMSVGTLLSVWSVPFYYSWAALFPSIARPHGSILDDWHVGLSHQGSASPL